MKQSFGMKPAILTGSLGLLLILGSHPATSAESQLTAPAESIGGHKSVWIDSQPLPENARIDAKVDVGTLTQIDDAFEVRMLWPLLPDDLSYVRNKYQDQDIPDQSSSFQKARVVCRSTSALRFTLETGIMSPSGQIIHLSKKDPVQARKEAETQLDASSYGADPYSLVCYAAARKCDNKTLNWPPPKNNTPLEYSEKAAQSNRHYNAMFVPSCKLN